MPTALSIVLILLWTAWVAQALLSILIVRKSARRFTRKPRETSGYTPPVTVIVPFKGLDHDLAANVRSLFEQDYPDYRLMLVVDSAADPACPVLQAEMSRHPERRAELLVAGPAGANEGQKVHNQLFAIDRLEPQADDNDVWVFCDSDAVPGPNWLRQLVLPLRYVQRTGVTTGYRWLIPAHDDGSCAFWSHLASVINSSVACVPWRSQVAHAWGGSMALRVATARRGRLRELLAGALTDDYQFTRLCRNLGLRVYFVARCLVATPVHFSLPSLVNFAHRQYLLTRVYAPRLFAAALWLTGMYMLGCVSAWLALLVNLGRAPARWQGWIGPAAVIAVVFIANQVRAGLRRRVVAAALGPDVLRRLAPTLRWDRWATGLWMALHLLLALRALFGRTMNWRGIRYRLHGPQSCERL